MENLNGVLFVISGFLAKEAYDWAKQKLSKQSDQRADKLDQNTEAIHTLNLNLTKMEGRLELLVDKLTIVPALSDKVQELMSQMREVRVTLKI